VGVRTDPDDDLRHAADTHGEAASPALVGYTGYLLRRVYGRAVQVAQTVMPPGSHPRDFAVLGALAGRDAISQQDVAEQLKINRTIMVKVIDKLEADGYVIRQRNPRDRRAYMLSVPARRPTAPWRSGSGRSPVMAGTKHRSWRAPTHAAATSCSASAA
jgi:biotin operon repressor